MMVSVPARLAFLAMPRAASSSIQTEISHKCDIVYAKPPAAKHMNYHIFSRKILPQLKFFGIDELETVAVFREPLDWLHSWYCYRKMRWSKVSGAKQEQSFASQDISFNTFTEAYLQDNPPDFARVGQQSRFVSDDNGQCRIDHLFKFTNLIGLQSFLAARLQSEFLFLPTNVSKRIPLDLSPQLRHEIGQRFALDYDIYERIAH